MCLFVRVLSAAVGGDLQKWFVQRIGFLVSAGNEFSLVGFRLSEFGGKTGQSKVFEKRLIVTIGFLRRLHLQRNSSLLTVSRFVRQFRLGLLV
jgi:hypothetical protein